jgi:hypothetical protein
MDLNKKVNKQEEPSKNHGIPREKRESEEKTLKRDDSAKKQDAPRKNHGLPQDKHEPNNEEDEEQDFGGMKGENFRKNLGCGG